MNELNGRVSYPKRESYFAIKFIRAILQAGVATELGLDVFALLTAVVSVEDHKRYSGPVTWHNDPLQRLLGFRKWERLATARKRAIESGWLHYDPPASGARGPGKYWVTCPPDQIAQQIPLDDRGDLIGGAYPQKGAGRGEPYPFSGDARVIHSPERGDGQGDTQGYAQGELSIPNPEPNPTCPAPAGGDVTPAKPQPRKRARPEFTSEDLELAEWMWSLIVSMQPTRKLPNLDKWANTFRMMREKDGRTYHEIRTLFDRANHDSFWRINILSPEKLREKWDDLQLKLGGRKSVDSPSQYQLLDRHNRNSKGTP